MLFSGFRLSLSSAVLASLLLFLERAPGFVNSPALTSRDDKKASEFAYYNVDKFPLEIREAVIPKDPGQCNMVLQAQDIMFFGTRIHAFPACNLSPEQRKGLASVSWPESKPIEHVELQEDWGTTFYLVRGMASTDTAETINGTLVLLGKWDHSKKIGFPPIIVLPEKDWTYSTASYQGGQQIIESHSLLGPWLNPYTHITGETVCKDRPLDTKCLEDLSERAYVRHAFAR